MATYTVTDGTDTLFIANQLRGDTLVSRKRGDVQTLRFAFGTRGHYLAARAFTEYVGAVSHGRTLGGNPWYVETLASNATVESHVVHVEIEATTAALDSFWGVFVDAAEATPPPGIDYAIDFDVLYLAPGVEFASRDGVEQAFGASITE